MKLSTLLVSIHCSKLSKPHRKILVSFRSRLENLTVVITAKDSVFKMKVRPRWHADDGMTDTIGAEIEKAPWEWTEFVINLDKKDEDVWGNW